MNVPIDFSFDANRAYQHVMHLAFPRGVGSAGETEARAYIVRHFTELGLHVVREPFHFTKFPSEVLPRLICAIFTPIVLLVPWLGERFPMPVCLLCIGSLTVAMVFTQWRQWLEKLYDVGKKYRSENVIATNDVPQSPQSEDTPTLLFMAHYDSKSQVLPIAVRAAAYGIAIVGLTALASVTLAKVLFNLWLPTGFLWGIAGTTAFCLLLLQFNFTQNRSPGGFDNASGVGVLLELARYCQEHRGSRCIFLATGAEEYGLCGALRYIQRHADALRTTKTYVINLDGLGVGSSVNLITRYGIPPVRTAQKLSAKLSTENLACNNRACGCPSANVIARNTLSNALRQGEETLGVKVTERYFPIGVGFDSMPIASRGFEAVTLTSGDVGKVALKVHSKHDRGELLNVESLQRVGELIVNFIEHTSQTNVS